MSRGQTVDAALRGPAKGASRVFILLSGALTYGAAGLANSVISRVSILSQAGYSVSLLVDVWQRDLGMHVKRLKENGRLGDQVEVRNIYDDLQNHLCPVEGGVVPSCDPSRRPVCWRSEV